MKNIIFLTKTLNLESIKQKTTNSSSGLFEFNLTSELSKKTSVSIIHLSNKNTAQELVNGISYTSINFKSILGLYLLIKEIARNSTRKKSAIINTGYYAIETIAILTAAKFLQIKSFCFVYDTHKVATSRMSGLKKLMSELYFSIGFYFVKKNNGLFVLNDKFINKLNIKTPFHKTRIGINNDDFQKIAYGRRIEKIKDKSLKIIFAGTINSENGVDLLLEFYERNKNINIDLDFYGSGDMTTNVKKISKIDNRIKLHERLPNKILIQKLQEADFLINLRDPSGLSSDYAFPSKLINFMSTGTPVICNKFPGLENNYEKHLYIINNYTIEDLSIALLNIYSGNYDKKIGISAMNFIKENNNWDKISDEIIEFMSNKPQMTNK